MEITRTNFNEFLPEIQKAVNDCLFVTIDCEMTGLNSTPNNINTFDTPAQYYSKSAKSSRDFLVIQYGLSLFKYNAVTNNFTNRSYNFYIFRRPVDRNVPDQRFLCQTSSIDFLITQGFDFNKLFKEGISYINITEEENYKENLEQQRKKAAEFKKSGTSIISVPEKDRPFLDDIVKQIEAFIDGNEKEVELPKCNSFVRRLIYQTVQENYAKKVNLETRTVQKDRILVVTRPKSLQEEKELEEKNYNEKLNDLDDYVGFTKVLRMVVEAQKLVVGHNLCLDLLHTIDKFLTPLPTSYAEFKEVAHSLFPKVLDTKYMSSEEPFKDFIVSNVLKQLLDTVSEKPFEMPTVEIEEAGRSYDLNDPKEHEAGYDAYITGLSFLSMWKFLGLHQNVTENQIFKKFDLLSPYMNKIFLMRLSDNQFINLSGEDMNPSRDHVFYITFPKEWKTTDIFQLFSHFGNVYVAWIDETSAYVSLYKKQEAAAVLSTLSSNDTFTICSFTDRLKNATFERNKRRITSPIGAPAKKARLAETKSKGRIEGNATMAKTFAESGEWE